MKLIAALLLVATLPALAEDPTYVTVATYADGTHFQAWRALPLDECKKHIGLIDMNSVPRFKDVHKPLTCEKADTWVIQRTKTGNTVKKQPWGIGPTTAAICKQWVSGPLKQEATAEVTYSCEKAPN